MKQYYVSPDGCDTAAGSRNDPATLEGILNRIPIHIGEDPCEETEIILRGGEYRMSTPLHIETEVPLTLHPEEGETAVLEGGIRIENFEESEKDGRRLWLAHIPAGMKFSALYGKSERLSRASLPKNGYYVCEDVPGLSFSDNYRTHCSQFVAKEGDFPANAANLTDICVHFYHFWVDEHLRVSSYDPVTRTVTMSESSRIALYEDTRKSFARYHLDNVFEGLTEPGEWYLDSAKSLLYYLPEDGQTPQNTVLYAPVAEQLLSAENTAGLTVKNVIFRHTDACACMTNPSWQGACGLPAAVSFHNCRNCRLENCEISHTGYYALDIMSGRDIDVSHCTLSDLGAGGIKIDGADASGVKEKQSSHIRICDNVICAGGREFLAGVGILSMNANHVTISHNHIYDLYYTGVSCGWVWGYEENVSHDNRIEYNHIHDIGHGVLSDMGGVYLLGVQPGTVVKNNLIHHIDHATYGGWAIYPDEGSSHLVIENNVCYRASAACFHQHYGRENLVINNIFAYGGGTCLAWTRPEDHTETSLYRNIFLTDGQPLYLIPEGVKIRAEGNLIWDMRGKPPLVLKGRSDGDALILLKEDTDNRTDLFSIAADPLFEDAGRDLYTLSPDSPAFELGFRAIDMSEVGVRFEEGLSRKA